MTLLPPLASVEDLEAWLGATFDGDAKVRASACIRAASATVRAEAGVTWVTENEDDPPVTVLDDPPADVVSLVVRVAANLWANPTGTTQQSAGPFGASYGAALTDDDRRLLGRFKGSSGLFTITTTRCDPADVATYYVDVVGSDEPLPVFLEEPC